jgi:flagellar assembly factor FliW
MDIQTKAMGTVTVSDKQLLFFPEGLFGFEEIHNYALLEAEQKPFMWLQSIEKPELAFLLIDPFLFRFDYELDVDDITLGDIGVSSPSDVYVLAIITIPPEGAPITANLRGPLVINKNNNNAIQTILPDPKWQIKHDIVAEMKAGKH